MSVTLLVIVTMLNKVKVAKNQNTHIVI